MVPELAKCCPRLVDVSAQRSHQIELLGSDAIQLRAISWLAAAFVAADDLRHHVAGIVSRRHQTKEWDCDLLFRSKELRHLKRQQRGTSVLRAAWLPSHLSVAALLTLSTSR